MLAQTGGQMNAAKDIGRCPDNNASYRLYSAQAKKHFYRSWQHRQLWQIDPDCITFVAMAV